MRGRGHLLERGQAPADQPPPADREQQDQRAPRDQLGDDDAADLAGDVADRAGDHEHRPHPAVGPGPDHPGHRAQPGAAGHPGHVERLVGHVVAGDVPGDQVLHRGGQLPGRGGAAGQRPDLHREGGDLHRHVVAGITGDLPRAVLGRGHQLGVELAAEPPAQHDRAHRPHDQQEDRGHADQQDEQAGAQRQHPAGRAGRPGRLRRPGCPRRPGGPGRPGPPGRSWRCTCRTGWPGGPGGPGRGHPSGRVPGRRLYPTPRCVWMSGGPSGSSLCRR